MLRATAKARGYKRRGRLRFCRKRVSRHHVDPTRTHEERRPKKLLSPARACCKAPAERVKVWRTAARDSLLPMGLLRQYRLLSDLNSFSADDITPYSTTKDADLV